jgi:hypothetical protein
MTQGSDAAEARRSYSMGDVGAGARVVQGDHNSWNEGLRLQPGGTQVALELAELLHQIQASEAIEPDDRELAVEKVAAVADALPKAAETPDVLRKALRDARQFLSSNVRWAWQRIQALLTSEAGRQVLGTITDAAARAAIQGLLG